MARGTQAEIEAATRAFHAAEAHWHAALEKHYGKAGSASYSRARYEVQGKDYVRPVRLAWEQRDAARIAWERACGMRG